LNLFSRVLGFMDKFGQHVPEPFVPTVPRDEVIRRRCRWLMEEAFELLSACFANDPKLVQLRGYVFDFIDNATVLVDLVQYADANSDIRYVATGNDIAAGIDSRDIDAEVCRSNDSKSPPEVPGGKVRKGDGYSPPAIIAILREQGWDV